MLYETAVWLVIATCWKAIQLEGARVVTGAIKGTSRDCL